MKNHIIISLLFLSIGLSQKEYNYNDLIEMDNGLYTIKFSDEPITGKVYDYFEEFKPYSGAIISGKKVYMGNLLNGEKEGRWKSYFHSNGKKKFDENWKDGERDGLFTQWYENGKKQKGGTYKDGELDGLWTWWFENGQKKGELTYKDGKKGLRTGWYKNGQKEREVHYKDGGYDVIRRWNEDGSVRKEPFWWE